MGNRALREKQARVPWNRMLRWKGYGPTPSWRRRSHHRMRSRMRTLLADVTKYELDVCAHDPDNTVYPERNRDALDIWSWW